MNVMRPFNLIIQDFVKFSTEKEKLANYHQYSTGSLNHEKQLVINCSQKFNIFTNRIANVWNILTREVVEQETINEATIIYSPIIRKYRKGVSCVEQKIREDEYKL
ncbi:hypothetical protein BpHYR1_018579 [Brachionus plicatilis]|uniref:Uncharacterized protein n=1 Tax=Brachionus plicatilis TaxID=10195 RepID=A0A3M7QJI1_BRAPC|nr:hypothetical protein BpHYR1_018579 [Brachionus plicatilis]